MQRAKLEMNLVPREIWLNRTQGILRTHHSQNRLLSGLLCSLVFAIFVLIELVVFRASLSLVIDDQFVLTEAGYELGCVVRVSGLLVIVQRMHNEHGDHCLFRWKYSCWSPKTKCFWEKGIFLMREKSAWTENGETRLEVRSRKNRGNVWGRRATFSIKTPLNTNLLSSSIY